MISISTFPSCQKISQELKMLIMDMDQPMSIIHSHERLNTNLKKRIEELNSEKLLLDSQCINHNKEINELKHKLQCMEESTKKQIFEDDIEKNELYSRILGLQKEITFMSSSSLVKERDSLRKDLEKNKVKLKETESKLKSTLQDKSKLEGEKAQAEREVKHLHAQKALLERDICKRDSKAIDFSKGKSNAINVEKKIQMDYQMMESHFFEMESEISSFKEKLLAATEEKEEAINRCHVASLEMEDLADKLNRANSELKQMKEAMNTMVHRLSESENFSESLKSSIDLLSREKEEMMLQLTNSLLELEMEACRHSSMEKDFAEKNGKVMHELDSFRNQCQLLTKKLALSEEDARQMRLVMSLEVPKLKYDMRQHELDSERREEFLRCQLLSLTKEKDYTFENNEKLSRTHFEDEIIKKNYEDKLKRANFELEKLGKRIANLEIKIQDDALDSNKENTKVRMKLHWTNAKLEAYRGKYEDAIGEMRHMKKKYHEATLMKNKQLALYGKEILRLQGKPNNMSVEELLQIPL